MLKEIFWSTPDFGSTRILCIFNLNELGGKERVVGFQTLCTVKPEKSLTCHCLCIFPSRGHYLCLCVQSICHTCLCICLCLWVQSQCLPSSLCTIKLPLLLRILFPMFPQISPSPLWKMRNFQIITKRKYWTTSIPSDPYDQILSSMKNHHSLLCIFGVHCLLAGWDWSSISWWYIIAKYTLLNKFWK